MAIGIRRSWIIHEGTPTVPSWIVSVALHAGLLFLFAISLRSCGTGSGAGPGAADFREVGIYVAEQTTTAVPNEAIQPTSPAEPTRSTSQVPPTLPPDLESNMSQLLDLPQVDTSAVIGPGSPTLPALPARVQDLLAAPGVHSSQPNLAAGQGTTSFFDIKAQGTRFVYVLDRSGSMDSYGAILVAKAELTASLQSLESTQQFQIVFYNMSAAEMTSPSRKRRLFWATDINRTLARQFIAGIYADGGTNHLPALRKALAYGPEHLFFLTDADQPQLSAADLDEIRRLNAGKTHLHCIEFGKGPDVPVDNFLKRLARQNGGTYRYRDVTQFARVK